jgi:hypothetical protein
VPASARAVAANLTAVSPTAAGSLTAYPAGALEPATITLAFPGGRTRANNVELGLGPAADLTVRSALPAGQSVHLVVDVVGYFQ